MYFQINISWFPFVSFSSRNDRLHQWFRDIVLVQETRRHGQHFLQTSSAARPGWPGSSRAVLVVLSDSWHPVLCWDCRLQIESGRRQDGKGRTILNAASLDHDLRRFWAGFDPEAYCLKFDRQLLVRLGFENIIWDPREGRLGLFSLKSFSARRFSSLSLINLWKLVPSPAKTCLPLLDCPDRALALPREDPRHLGACSFPTQTSAFLLPLWSCVEAWWTWARLPA